MAACIAATPETALKILIQVLRSPFEMTVECVYLVGGVLFFSAALSWLSEMFATRAAHAVKLDVYLIRQ